MSDCVPYESIDTELYGASYVPEYGYNEVPIFGNPYQYTSTYDGGLQTRPGCREAITHLAVAAADDTYRRLVAGTKSRIYALNERTGNWRIIADGLGGDMDQAGACDTCSRIRFRSTTIGNYMLFTNDFDQVLAWQFDASPTGSDLWSAHYVEDLIILGVTRARCITNFQGFAMIGNVDQEGQIYANRLYWSDYNSPLSWIPGDTSLANYHDFGLGEKIIRAEPLGKYLMVYTDKAVYQGVLVADTDLVFQFDRVYLGPNTIKFEHTLVNTGTQHCYLSENGVYVVALNNPTPQRVEWMHLSSAAIYTGIGSDILAGFEGLPPFGPINMEVCEQAVGGYNALTEEVWFSWPTDSNTCPNMTLVYNLRYGAADLVDNGFTAFINYAPDDRQTVRDFLYDQQICPLDVDEVVVAESYGYGTTSSYFNFNNFQQWNVTSGNVDLIGPVTIDGTSLDLVPGHGFYVDMSGTPGPGTIETKEAVELPAGTYTFSFLLAGNNRDSGDSSAVRVQITGLLDTIVTPSAWNEGFTLHSYVLVVGSDAEVFISFAGQGPASFKGGLLDDITITRNGSGQVMFSENFDDEEVGDSEASYTTTETVTSTNFIKEGPPLGGAGALSDPPLFLWNLQEDPTLPLDPDSWCARLGSLREDELCEDCEANTIFILADAEDYCLKEYDEEVFYREKCSFVDVPTEQPTLGPNLLADVVFNEGGAVISGLTPGATYQWTRSENGYEMVVSTRTFPDAAGVGTHYTTSQDLVAVTDQMYLFGFPDGLATSLSGSLQLVGTEIVQVPTWTCEQRGYCTLLQSDMSGWNEPDEKLIKTIVVDYDAAEQSPPSLLYCEVAYSSQPRCTTWRGLGTRELRCLTESNAAEHEANNTRPDLSATFPTYYRGRFLGYRIFTCGIGGSACYSRIILAISKAQARLT